MQKWKKIVIYSFILAFFFLMIGSKSSPIYPMNDWVDANAFFTMGKGIVHGLVPYRDLFEQKGPILYFIYAISYLISNHTFLGVFFIEVIALTVALFYFYKILVLYEREHQFYLSAPFVLTILLTMKAFTHGGSCEELMFPFFIMSFYHFLYLLKEKQYKQGNRKLYFYEGIIVGIILWTKFILLGFWIGFVLFIGFLLLINKNYKELFKMIISYLLGILVVTLPILIYFGIYGALDDLFNAYFYFNIFAYPPEESFTILERLAELWDIYFVNMKRNSIYMVTLLLGIVAFIRDKKIIKRELKIGVLIVYLSTFFFNYIGLKRYIYYFLVMSPFIVLFGIFISNVFTHIHIPTKYMAIIVIPVLWFFVYQFSPNTYFIETSKESLAQYTFADIINQEENPTLLQYGYLDCGFYMVADILPTEKYFMKLNISYDVFPDIMDAQNLAIQEKHTDFVVMRLGKDKDSYDLKIPYLYDSYEVIKEQIQSYGQKDYKYVLFKKRSE